MIKKILATFLAVFILFSITGCQLAIEDKGEIKSKDRLIGVFVTEEHLDLFDMEEFFKDNAHKLFNGSSTNMDYNNKKYQKRLYATLVTQLLTSQDGDTFETKEYVFEGVDGISYFAATVPATENEISYITSGSDDAISDGHIGIIESDNEDKITLEGTIYVSAARAGKIHHFNPVYQSPGGSVYALSGNSAMLGGLQDEGSIFSTTLDETTTVTENGKSKSVSNSVKISIATLLPPEKITVLQMDKDSNIISRMEYSPGKLPDTITPADNTEYIIAESHSFNLEGKAAVSRSIYDRKAETLDTFYCRDDGICVKQWTNLDWNKN
ncbi:MAG TPA: hypothetical protein GXZ22_08595 [Clostridiaceae bacterium]|nr:hypothetical protein [Clostridiaceae bacterium]